MWRLRRAPILARVFSALNLVCLDAPIVAVSWQWLFAQSFGVVIAPGATAALFLTAWLIYLADRFGDSLSLGDASAVSLRQDFCRRHKAAWLGALAIIAVADLFVIVTQLDRVAIRAGAAVGALAFLYLTINRLRPSVWRALPLKEISIGFIFAAGTMVGVFRGLTMAALPAWLLFASLCALNCVSIAVWERDLDIAQERVSIATAFRAVRGWLLPAVGLVCATSVAFASFSSARGLHTCIAVSALLLGAVHVFRSRIQADVRTALADVVLLTPLIMLLGRR